jgi:hypothetical protein
MVESRAAGFKYAEERYFWCMSLECLHVARAFERGSMNENGNSPGKKHRQRPTTANGER